MPVISKLYIYKQAMKAKVGLEIIWKYSNTFAREQELAGNNLEQTVKVYIIPGGCVKCFT